MVANSIFVQNLSMQNFEELGLSPELCKTVHQMGFETPTQIQHKVIPYFLSRDRDILGIAQTGTGKTAAFGLPLIDLIDTSNPCVQGMILVPTRELCLQVCKDLRKFATNQSKIKILPLYGGSSVYKAKKDLKGKNHIIVGTPGRTLDMLNQEALNLKRLEYMILDEADEMLNMGFKEELDAILAYTPKKKINLCFSATLPSEAKKLVKRFLSDPIRINISDEQTSKGNIFHHYVMASSKNRLSTVLNILDENGDFYGIIFCRTKKGTVQLTKELRKKKIKADYLNGDLRQNVRDRVMKNFRRKNLTVLVATDVAARGIDVKELTHVINYNLPEDAESYIHRSGRTGRAGNSGYCISLIFSDQKKKIRAFAEKVGQPFTQGLPEGSGQSSRPVREEDPFKEKDRKKGDRREKERYKDKSDSSLQKSSKNNSKKEAGSKKPAKVVLQQYHLNMGTADGLSKKKFLQFLNNRIGGVEVGRIEIKKKYTLFEIQSDKGKKIKKVFSTLSNQFRTVVATEI